MSARDHARDHYVARHESFRSTLGTEPSWLTGLRSDAIGAFAERGLPSTRLEEWRYTNVTPLAKIPFECARGDVRINREDLEPVATPLFACSAYVFVDGHFSADLSTPTTPPNGCHVESIAALRERDPGRLRALLGRNVDLKEHPFAALNTAFIDDGAFVFAPQTADLGQPIHLVFVSTASTQPRVVHSRVLIVAEGQSRLTVIQDHVSLGDSPGFTNVVTEVSVGPGAQVDLVLLQREHDAQFHMSNLQIRAERDARVSAHTLSLGGALVRNDAAVLLAEEGVECVLNGLFIAGDEQVVDNHTLVDHAVPHCVSRELYKGVLGGSARGVFRGRIIVRPDAQKTNAFQSNPNLLLSRRAEINTKPQLEIYADDVKCSHGTTVGQIDADALFYLRSRGIDEDRARDLLTRAFALEMLEALPVPALGEGLDDVLLEKLRRVRHGATEA